MLFGEVSTLRRRNHPITRRNSRAPMLLPRHHPRKTSQSTQAPAMKRSRGPTLRRMTSAAWATTQSLADPSQWASFELGFPQCRKLVPMRSSMEAIRVSPSSRRGLATTAMAAANTAATCGSAADGRARLPLSGHLRLLAAAVRSHVLPQTTSGCPRADGRCRTAARWRRPFGRLVSAFGQ
jgi:hypothetical protein